MDDDRHFQVDLYLPDTYSDVTATWIPLDDSSSTALSSSEETIGDHTRVHVDTPPVGDLPALIRLDLEG